MIPVFSNNIQTFKNELDKILAHFLIFIQTSVYKKRNICYTKFDI